MSTRQPGPSEHEIQVSIIQWAREMEYREPRLSTLHSIPNGGKRPLKTAIDLKSEGLVAGVWDLHLPVACHGYHGLWLEIKSVSGRLSLAQRQWEAAMIEAGHYARVCRTVDEAVETVEWYLGMQGERNEAGRNH